MSSTARQDLTRSQRRQAGCGCALLLFLAVLAALGSLEDAVCETTTYATSASLTGWLTARVQMTDCGATTGFSRVVWVQPAWLPQSRLLACRAAALSGDTSVDLQWDDGALHLASKAPDARVIMKAKTCYGSSVQVTVPSDRGLAS